ncbi:MAG: peptidase MA family metallohydrolase [Thermodesulfovibrionales bacterium]
MSKKRIIISMIFLPGVLWTVFSYAGQLTLQDEKVIVRFDDHLRNAANEILQLYPSVRAELRKDLGWETDFRPEIVLMKDSASFRKVSGSDLVTAFAVPGEDLIVIDYSKMGVHPFTIDVTLKHELCHLELHRHITREKLPRWLDEGTCQWVTGGLAEIISEGGRSVLRDAVLSNRLISIEGLTRRFPSDGGDLILAYEESRSIVEYVKEKFGVSGLRGILERMSRGDDLEAAVRNALSISLDELERRWRSSIAMKNLWPSYIRDNLYEALFLFAALITICGFFRFLKRKREYKDEDDGGGEEGGT